MTTLSSLITGNFVGPIGASGPQGSIGASGPAGGAGPTGATGPNSIGASGAAGAQGATGPILNIVPQNVRPNNYTIALTDSAGQVFHPGYDTTPRTYTIPANSSVAFPIGSAVTFVVDSGAGSITLSITSDSLMWQPYGNTGSRTISSNGSATILKTNNTTWIVNGVGLS